jgi:beta-galactosidase
VAGRARADGQRRNSALADHWAAIRSAPGLQGGFIRESRDHGIVRRVSNGGPAGRAGARLHGGRATVPVRVALFRHEGVVVSNHQHLRGLEWLPGEWELCLADGGTLTAAADLPALAPGETRVVPLPFEVPRDGGEAWLTLRVRTAEDLPRAPRGTEVCTHRVRLRGPAAPEDPSREWNRRL